MENAIDNAKDFEDAIVRMSNLDPRIFDSHFNFLQVALMTGVNHEAEIMRRLKTVELRDEIELLVEHEKKERMERERFELVKAMRRDRKKRQGNLPSSIRRSCQRSTPQPKKILIRLQQLLLPKKPKKKNSWM